MAWFDSWSGTDTLADAHDRRVDWMRVVPFLAIHIACLGVIWTGFSPVAAWWALGLYLVRIFAITAFYHRYFSHRTFQTSRFWQFVFAVMGNMSAQRGPLWWAAHHRHHHRHTDTEHDTHSPKQDGFWFSHVGWILTKKNFRTDVRLVPDLARYRELVFLDRFDSLVPVLLFALSYGLGEFLAGWSPELRTSGWQMFVATLISTVVLFHATFTINSLAHVWGSRPYATRDTSRNNLWLALLTLGEGWHNNHHRYQAATQQGFRWYEIDVCWYLLRGMARLGIVRGLTPVPKDVIDERSQVNSSGC